MAGRLIFRTPTPIQWALGTIEGIGAIAASTAEPFINASVEKRRLAVKAAEARREAELKAAERAAVITNNDKLFTLVKWLSGTIAGSVIAYMVGSALRNRKKRGKK